MQHLGRRFGPSQVRCGGSALFAGRGHIAFKCHNHVAGNLQLLGGGGEVLAQGGVLRLEALNTLVERVALRDQVFAQGLSKGEVLELGNAGFAPRSLCHQLHSEPCAGP